MRLRLRSLNQCEGFAVGGRKITLVLDAHDDAADRRQPSRTTPKNLNVKMMAVVDDSAAHGQSLANEFQKTAKASTR